MALFTVRSERQFCEQLDYNLLFRWFLDMDMTESSFVPTAKNRDRLMAHDVAGEFLRAVIAQARGAKLMSSEHFTVDGTLIESWESLKSFKKRAGSDDDKKAPADDPGNPTVDFRGQKRSDETHQSTTDPDARLARKKGKESKLSYSAHALIENRNGLVVDFQMDIADGFAERRNALEMLDNNVLGERRITLGADKGYDTRDFVEDCRAPRHAARRAEPSPSAAARTSTRERRARPATRSVSGSESASKRSSAKSRRSVTSERRGSSGSARISSRCTCSPRSNPS